MDAAHAADPPSGRLKGEKMRPKRKSVTARDVDRFAAYVRDVETHLVKTFHVSSGEAFNIASIYGSHIDQAYKAGRPALAIATEIHDHSREGWS